MIERHAASVQHVAEVVVLPQIVAIACLVRCGNGMDRKAAKCPMLSRIAPDDAVVGDRLPCVVVHFGCCQNNPSVGRVPRVGGEGWPVEMVAVAMGSTPG